MGARGEEERTKWIKFTPGTWILIRLCIVSLRPGAHGLVVIFMTAICQQLPSSFLDFALVFRQYYEESEMDTEIYGGNTLITSVAII